MVRPGDLFLIGKIRLIADPADDHLCTQLSDLAHQQSLCRIHPHIAHAADVLFDQRAALFCREQRVLLRIDRDDHDHFIIEPGRPADQMQVAQRHRVKGSRKDRPAHAVLL